VDHTLNSLKAIALDPQVRPHLTTDVSGRKFRSETSLWRLTGESLALLHECFPLGLLIYVSGNSGWIEDPVFYRDAEMMFGVVSHENEGVIQASNSELAALEAIGGIQLREQSEWIWDK
jgi:hypothetical protein